MNSAGRFRGLSWNAKPNLLSGSCLSVRRIPFRNLSLQVILNDGPVNSIPVPSAENAVLSKAQNRIANVALTLALVVVPFFSSNMSAFAESPESDSGSNSKEHGEHRKPSPTATPTPIPTATGRPQQDQKGLVHPSPQGEQDEDSQKQSQIAQKYGDEREVATPPLIVKPANPVPSAVPSAPVSQNSVGGASVANRRKVSTKYVSQPLNVAMHQLLQPSTSQSAVKSQIKAFDASKNAPVIQNIRRDELGNPAQEFLAKAYFGMALVAIFGMLAVVYFYRKLRTSRGPRAKDGWLDLSGE